MPPRRGIVLRVAGIVVISSFLLVYAGGRFSAKTSSNLSAEVSISSTSWTGNTSTVYGTSGVPYSFSAVVSGGDPPYVSSWIFGDGTNGMGLAITHEYANQAANCYDGSFAVTDSTGDHTSADFTLNVSSGAFVSSSGGNWAGALPNHFSVCYGTPCETG
jgi:hypothetical protein